MWASAHVRVAGISVNNEYAFGSTSGFAFPEASSPRAVVQKSPLTLSQHLESFTVQLECLSE